MSSPGDDRPADLFAELWRRLGDCHQNTVQELEAKVSKLKKDRCLDAQRLEVFYNRNQQLKEENKTLQDTISHLEERLRAGECQRCAVLEENLKSSRSQNQQLISKLSEFRPAASIDHLPEDTFCSVAEGERNSLEDENGRLQAELRKLKASRLELKELSSPEQEEGIIPDSPILSSSLPATNKLKKLKRVDKIKHVRYAERPLSLSEKSIFFEPYGATKSSGRAEVLVPNTCELDAPDISEDVNNEEEIAETCGLELLDRPHMNTESDWNQQTCLKSVWKNDVRLRPYPPSSAPMHSPDSTTERSPSLLPCVKRFSEESSVSRMKRKKGETDEGVDEQKKGKRMQLEGSRQGSEVQSAQTGTSIREQNGPCLSPAFKKPHSKLKGDADGKERAPLLPHGDGEKHAVENMWSIDPALTLSVYEGGDEEKEEPRHLGELADTDCTWISHSMLQGRGEHTQDGGDPKSRLGEMANDSLDMMFDTTACGEYKSFCSSHFSQNQPCDDENKEEEFPKSEQDPPENDARQGKAGQPTFAHVAVVRKKDERRKLKGTTCKECEIYYAHLPEEEKQKKLSECSRHRFLYIPPCTPENFWEVGFPSTQTCIDRGYIREEKNPQARLRRRQPLSALFTPKKKQEQT
ncbi:DNA endonuclease RBBP8 [Xenentodon cancila]